MSLQTSQRETRVLTISALIATAFAVGGLLVGLLMGSIVIAFDGVYSLVSLLLTLLSLVAAKHLHKPESYLSQYGREIVEPIVIAIKASVILIIVGFSLYSAIMSLLEGGRPVSTSIATVFGIVNVVGCGFAWWYMQTHTKTLGSPLAKAECKQWQMDTMLSVAVTVGFITAWGLEITPWAQYSRYADPVMMIIMSGYFIKVPLVMLKEALSDFPSMPIRKVANNSL
ncbi:cation transporter [Vibrio sp. ZSDZ34]|jgi:predicted Co/Zn/Cd cation transporter (cation efflux family)|uniref:Cation transporter n=1 Tax=Vibrio gelatinilyticus TaxID=2893468 RepID=A0A9X1W9J1_9VIBR|nr:cation transporter [Vibrio gelatinilyticus]MCJ2376792.1 cation transporter [Vibrio gelatinilyticus]